MQPAVQQILRGTVRDQGAPPGRPSGEVAINRAFLRQSAHASGLLTVLFASMGEDLRAVISIGGSLQIFSCNIDVVSMGYRRQSVAILGSEVHVISCRKVS